MSGMPDGLVQARYIGEHAVELRGTVWNIDGTKRKEPSLEFGDVFMARGEDAYGKTLWHDPKGQKRSLSLGLGRNVLPEHVDVPVEELGFLGYEFHVGRSDFEPLQPLEPNPQEREMVSLRTILIQPDAPSEGGTELALEVPSDRITETPDEETKPKKSKKTDKEQD